MKALVGLAGVHCPEGVPARRRAQRYGEKGQFFVRNRALLALSMVGVLSAGCSADEHPGQDLPQPSMAFATAVTSPPAKDPAGTVLTSPPGFTALHIVGDVLVGLTEDGVVFAGPAPAATAKAVDLQRVVLSAPIHSLTPDNARPGHILLAGEGGVWDLDGAAATATQLVTVDGAWTAVARRADGGLIAGTKDGRVVSLPEGSSEPSKEWSRVSDVRDLVRVGDDVVLTEWTTTTVNDVHDEEKDIGLTLRAGKGLSSAVAGSHDRLFVADTTGNALLVYTADPVRLHQMGPVPESPWGLAFDKRLDDVWVTSTGTNEATAWSTDAGQPTQTHRLPTIPQAQAVAVGEDGTLYISSLRGGLQIVSPRDIDRAQSPT